MLQFVLKALEKSILFLIEAYRRLISPLLPPSCRFYPSCSEYAAESVRRYGPFKGSWRAILRLLKCHPFHPGGVDLP